MKKIICDFCGKQVNNADEYTLPCNQVIEVTSSNHAAILCNFGYKVEDNKKDVCPECREKIAALLDLVPKMQFINGDRTSAAIVFDDK